MKVVLSARAERNLIDIGVWIARDDPTRAFSFIRELRATCGELGQFPRAYEAYPKFGPNARRRVYGNYVIVYDVALDRGLILTIVHGARDIDSLTL